MSIEERVANGEHIGIWDSVDGDGHQIMLTVSHVGFSVYIEGENREIINNPREFVCTETYLTFGMMEEILKAMKEHIHLVEGEFRD